MSHFLPFSRPAIGDEEIKAVESVLRSGWITTGPQNHQLEQDFCEKFGSKHAIAVCSATAGMHVVLMAMGIGLVMKLLHLPKLGYQLSISLHY